jgi:transposase
MLSLPSSVRIWLHVPAVDLRKSFDSLAALVRDSLAADPLSGHLFVFRNKSGDRLKILFWDRDGLVIYYKRLEEGRFVFPPARDGYGIEIRSADLAMLLDGVDLQSVQRRKRYHRPTPA